ncbi:hypothetical protein TSUD_221680 [Trifolium subterraneum]|uniref:Uncharacterized protein n=1 Tax=Trifolium subterraneum TaxID=3900 RepID=A0A2Z6NC16_TRISU|nr:hypothetical protein TSUD_221680 [Trifolium subterraneum]
MPDSDEKSLPEALAEALADTDKIYQPAFRAFANIIASKLSPLSDIEVARLTDDEIVRLINTLPTAEIDHVIQDLISAFFDTIGEAISTIFAPIFNILFWTFFGFFLIALGGKAFQQERPKPSTKPIVLSKYSGTPALEGLKCIAETYIQENSTCFRQVSFRFYHIKCVLNSELIAPKCGWAAMQPMPCNLTEVEQPQEGTSRAVVRSSGSVVQEALNVD